MKLDRRAAMLIAGLAGALITALVIFVYLRSIKTIPPGAEPEDVRRHKSKPVVIVRAYVQEYKDYKAKGVAKVSVSNAAGDPADEVPSVVMARRAKDSADIFRFPLKKETIENKTYDNYARINAAMIANQNATVDLVFPVSEAVWGKVQEGYKFDVSIQLWAEVNEKNEGTLQLLGTRDITNPITVEEVEELPAPDQ
jgi:hypothetical protein